MKSSPLSLLFGALFGVMVMLGPRPYTEWSTTARKIASSITRLDLYIGANDVSTCTAFAINTRYQYFLTAAHCKAPIIKTAGITARIMMVNEDLDLMVLAIPGRFPPLAALPHAVTNAHQGDAVAVLGYAEGLEQPGLRTGVVQIATIRYPVFSLVGDHGFGQLVIIDTAFIGGQSGGPIVNRYGEVVSIAQMTDRVNGMGRPLDVILDAVGGYWGR